MILGIIVIASVFALGALIWHLIKKFLNHLFQDNEGADLAQPMHLTEKGDLIWKDGTKDIKFIPNKDGRFSVTQAPSQNKPENSAHSYTEGSDL